MNWVISQPFLFFPLILLGLLAVVEAGARLRHLTASLHDEHQAQVASARDNLNVLVSLLLGFSLPMALPHFDLRYSLVTGEANAIATADQRAYLLPEPARSRAHQLIRQYVDERLEYLEAEDRAGVVGAVNRARGIQRELWREAVEVTRNDPRNLNPVYSLYLESVTELPNFIEEATSAEEKRIPQPLWICFIAVAILACFVVGYSMRRRNLLAMMALPLTVAIVLTLDSELDITRSGLVRVSQRSMRRIQQELHSPQPLPVQAPPAH